MNQRPLKAKWIDCHKNLLRAGFVFVALLCLVETARGQAIVGTVKTVGGMPIEGVQVRGVRASPFQVVTTTTDFSGGYVLGAGLSGTYTVQALENSYTFTPATTNVTVSGASVMGVNFTSPSTVPEATTLNAVVRATSATLRGSVNPNGGVTTAWFEYGLTTSYGSISTSTNVGGGSNNITFNIAVTNLLNGTNYHFRVVADNSHGTRTGSDATFATLAGNPTVATLVPTGGNATVMTLNGSVDPNGANATAWFEWGATTNYGNATQPQNLGNGVTLVNFNQALMGLTTAVTYHYRAVAMTSFATNYGADVSFTPLFSDIAVGLPAVFLSSAAWGDYDNDGRLDILLAGQSNSEQRISQVWRNTGSGFTNINAGLTPVDFGSVAWGDYDNDGRLDVLLTGRIDQSNYVCQIWRNTSSGFVEISAGLPGVYQSSAVWGDYDKDGRLDILLTGRTNHLSGTAGISQVWRNTGSGFTNINAGLPGVSGSSAAWGDYDGDGRLDILLTGSTNLSVLGEISQVWWNTGSGFSNINAGLTGVYLGSVAWGDYDNDGRLDVLLSGSRQGEVSICEVWRNTSDGFTNINAGLPGVAFSSSAWGDYDNDGRLDILVTGSGVGGSVAQLWRNTSDGFVAVNVGLQGVVNGSVAWGDYDDDGRLDILLTGRPNMVTGSAIPGQVWRNHSPVTVTQPPPGLVSWWQAENDATDSVGLHHGTLQNGTAFAPGKVGQAFNFDGTDDYVDLGNWFNLPVFTIAMWVKASAVQQTYADIIDNNHTGSRSWVVQYQNTGLRFNWGVAPRAGVLFDLTADTWHFLVMTFDSAHVGRLYLDGSIVGTETGSPPNYDGSQFLRLGAWGGGGRHFNGQIDEVQVYDRALTPAEVIGVMSLVHRPRLIISSVDNQHARVTWPTNATGYVLQCTIGLSAPAWATITNTPTVIGDRFVLVVDTTVGSKFYRLRNGTNSSPPQPTDLISWWRAENDATDSAGPNHGTLQNGTTFAPGNVGQAFSLNGANQYVLIGDPVPPSLQIQNEITLSAWIYVTAYPGSGTLGLIVGSQYDAQQAGATIFLDGRTSPDGHPAPAGHIHFQIGNGSWHTANANAQVPLNQWVHIAATRKANEDARIYYNGVLQPSTSVPWSGTISYSGAWLAIGQQKDINRPFDGLIDEVRIYDRALTQEEVAALVSGP